MPSGGEARARAFYQDLLGIPELAKPAPLMAGGGCWFERGELRVHLGVEHAFRPARKAHPAFVVDQLEELAAALREFGCECRVDGELPGCARLFVDDPFGNRIELLELSDPE